MQSSRRFEREAGRNVEVMWLLGWLAPDHKTVADRGEIMQRTGLNLKPIAAEKFGHFAIEFVHS
ncbi:hypothetical protein CP49_08855 [Bradyrhizobium valentinum]|uniref:Transposase InsH N-terminal domain-containing protein n=1 Tax=Bradyrhizobium valentinum TaxID=1518501 RepID=A0A0R3LYL0_9BRAD|nr:hypothetical protein CP49_08855 [Bradyrhizobium valentinum]